MNESRLHRTAGRWPRQILIDAGGPLPPEHRAPLQRELACAQAARSSLCRIERLGTTVGTLVAASALLSLASVGVAVVSPCDFLWLWATLTFALTPLSVFVHRSLEPLFSLS